MTTLDLREPIQAHGETVRALTFRKPTGKDIRLHGYPIRFDSERPTEVAFVEDKMHAMIAVLASIPPSSVDQLSPSDWLYAALTVSGFFSPTVAATSSTATTISDAGGATSAT